MYGVTARRFSRLISGSFMPGSFEGFDISLLQWNRLWTMKIILRVPIAFDLNQISLVVAEVIQKVQPHCLIDPAVLMSAKHAIAVVVVTTINSAARVFQRVRRATHRRVYVGIELVDPV